jgi:hypothetical protein
VARGVAPGRAVGAGLRAARDLWLASGCRDDAETRERLIARALEAAAAP